MKLVRNFILNCYGQTKESIKNIKLKPLESCGQLLPIAMMLISCIGAVSSLISFVTGGGLGEQIEAVSHGDLISGILEGYTIGTVETLLFGVTSKIIFALIVAEIIIILLSYVKKETKIKTVFAITLASFGSICVGLAGLVFAVAFGKIQVNEAIETKIIEFIIGFENTQPADVIAWFRGIAVIGLISLVIFAIMILVSSSACMMKSCVIALIVSYFILPLLMLVIENIFPICMSALAFIFVALVLFLIIKMFLMSGDDGKGDNLDSRKVNPVRESESSYKEKKDPYQKEIPDWAGPFWRDKSPDSWGVVIAAEDHIYCKDVHGKPKAVCGVSKFENGDIAIIDKNTKKRVMNIAGCKTPKK